MLRRVSSSDSILVCSFIRAARATFSSSANCHISFAHLNDLPVSAYRLCIYIAGGCGQSGFTKSPGPSNNHHSPTIVSNFEWPLIVAWLRHDDVNKWKHFPRYWPFVRGIHRSPVKFPTQRPVTRSFDVFFDLRLNKWLSKQSWGWWFETRSCPLWRHCNGTYASERWVIISSGNDLLSSLKSSQSIAIFWNLKLFPIKSLFEQLIWSWFWLLYMSRNLARNVDIYSRDTTFY